jgi:transketolase C-terminal domain/subunit
VLTTGTTTGAVVAAADALLADGVAVGVGVVSCPLHLEDEAMEWATSGPLLMTVEDHGVRTGLAASVAEWLALRGSACRLSRVGVEAYQSSGAASELYARAGLDTPGVERFLRAALGIAAPGV